MSKPVRHNFMIGLIDFFLLNVALFSVQLIKRGSLELSNIYMALFVVFYLAWLAVALFMRKFRKIMGKTFFDSLVLIVKSNMAIVFIVSFSIVLWAQLTAASRMQTFGVCVVFFLLELVGFFFFYILSGNKIFDKQPSGLKEKTGSQTTYYPLVIIDIVLLIAIFITINYIKRGSFSLPPRYDQMILILYGLLVVVSFIVKKYDKNNFNSTYTTAISPCIKATLIMGAALSVIVFALRLFYYSRFHLYSTFAVLFGCEVVVYYVYWAYRKYGKIDEDIETADQVKAVLDLADDERHLPEESRICPIQEAVETKLNHALEFFSKTLFDFIRKNIDLSMIDRCNTAIMSTDEIEDIQNLDENRHQLFINLHKTNDVRWFNRYFLQVYGKLKTKGYFIGKAHTITTHKKHYMDKYPRFVAPLFYYANFIWCRVFPKLPYIKKIYFTITRGRNRMVSKAEIFGRLNFLGFRIIDELEIENRLFFIAQKVKKPSLNKNPSYGPIVRLKRHGFNGNMITVYKFRTMYPYSEFLQDYVYKKNKLQEGGKINNDFRITDWGRFMRKFWIDEIPMLYNWIRGDMQLFGIRPLSPHYLSLYFDELRCKRSSVKPGLIPPFYADMPKTFEEICNSEERYIQAYNENPLKTQWVYFWKVFYNIVIKGARSG